MTAIAGYRDVPSVIFASIRGRCALPCPCAYLCRPASSQKPTACADPRHSVSNCQKKCLLQEPCAPRLRAYAWRPSCASPTERQTAMSQTELLPLPLKERQKTEQQQQQEDGGLKRQRTTASRSTAHRLLRCVSSHLVSLGKHAPGPRFRFRSTRVNFETRTVPITTSGSTPATLALCRRRT